MSPKVRFDPVNAWIEVDEGTTIVEAARAAGVPLNTLCIGNGACGKCLVICESSSKLSPVTLAEELNLGQELLNKGYRLGCLTRVYGDVPVIIPAQSLRAWAPVVKKGGELLDRAGYLHQERTRVDDSTVGHVRDSGLGLALDLGTTTLAGYLHDLGSKETLATAAVLNPQVIYGADIVTRLSYAARDRDSYMNVRQALFRGVNQVLAIVLKEIDKQGKDLKKITVVGNGFMHHSFLGLDLTTFITYPYAPLATDTVVLRAEQLGESGLSMLPPDVVIEMLPLIGGFVGSDLVAGMLATGVHSLRESFLYLDLGTNNEIALGDGHRILVGSTSAGPAFEGGTLSCGMRAQPGAIDSVSIGDGGPTYSTIEHIYPQGICGSGAISLLAELLRNGIVDERGRLCQANGLVRGHKAYVVAPGEFPIGLTTKDIEELQKAKAAVFAAAVVLAAELGISLPDVDWVFIAGAFGTHLSVSDAITIGLLPGGGSPARYRPVGNAAGDGARLALLYPGAKQDLAALLGQVEHHNLANHSLFSEEFIKAMFLPHEDERWARLTREL